MVNSELDKDYILFLNVHVFLEHPVKNYLIDNCSIYDVTGRLFLSPDFIVQEKFSNHTYCRALFLKILEIALNQIPEFLDYQLGMITNKRQWLYDLEKLFELNPNLVRYYKGALEKFIPNAIADKLSNLQNKKSENNLVWKGTETELLELVVALTHSGKVVNKEGKSVRADVIRAFEDLFGEKFKNEKGLLQMTKNRKKEKAPFLKLLAHSFESWLVDSKK